jgi:hypothetical protein
VPTGFPDYYGGLTLPVTVPEGGTGLTSLVTNALLIGQGSSAMIPTNVGTANQVLQIPSGGGAPTFQALAGDVSTFTGILAIAHGGTGAASFEAAGLPQIVAEVDLTGQTAAIGATPLATPAAAGFYGLTGSLYINSPTGNTTVTVVIRWTQNGTAFSSNANLTLGATGNTLQVSGSVYLFADAGTNITYEVATTNGGGADAYDLHLRLEALS